MKKFLAVMLSLLMILPIFTTYAFGDTGSSSPDVTSQATNIANQATIEIDGENILDSVRTEVLVDGNRESGTKSPSTRTFSYILSFDETSYFTDVIIVCNGKGTLATKNSLSGGETFDEIQYNITVLTATFYKEDKVLYTETKDVSKMTEWHIKKPLMADKIVVTVGNEDCPRSSASYIWEIETYALTGIELCDVQLHNIASSAEFSFDSYREDDPETPENEKTDPWWAVKWSALTDGNVETGTHSPKGGQYSFFMSYPKEYLFSEITFYCNGRGTLVGNGQKLEEYVYNNSMVQILLYDIDGELVYDSKDISVSGLEAKIDPYVEAATIEFRMFNGKHSGAEYMWEIQTMVETGNHLFEMTDSANPTCDESGYKEFSCHCGKVIKQIVPATGFHQWDDGVILEGNEATNEANGILTKTCALCGSTGEFDIPATGHNWNTGTVVPPTCTDGGYTKYECLDDGCTLSYTADPKQATGHDWDDGEVITPAKVGVEGLERLTCRACGNTRDVKIGALKYSTNTEAFNIKEACDSVTVKYNTESDLYKPDITTEGEKLLAEEDVWRMFDDNNDTRWYAPPGSTVEIILDRTYYITHGDISATSNWARFDVFFYYDDQLNASSGTDNFQAFDLSNPKVSDMSAALKYGSKVNKIVISVNHAKWPNGNAAKIHDIHLTVHACEVIEENYYLPEAADARYTPATCTVDGKTVSICPVCDLETPVTLPHDEWGHTPGTLEIIEPPTCSTYGTAKSTCTDCSFAIEEIKVPPTYVHEFTQEVTFMDALCGFMGIKQIVCPGCGKVGSQEPIPATGAHNYDWVEKYPSTFTSEGENSWECTGCACVDPAVGTTKFEAIEKKTIEEELITFEGCSIRVTDYIGLRLTYRLNLEYFDVLGYECDIRVISEVTNAEGVTKTVESYGKYSEGKYDAETGEVSVVLNPYSVYDEYEVKTYVRLMNFLGVEYVDCEMDLSDYDANNNEKVSVYEVVKYLVDNKQVPDSKLEPLFNEIVAGKK